MPADRIRVLRVITWLPVGGIERKIVDVLPRLDPERFDVSLVCLKRRGPLADELEAAGIRVDCVPFASRWDPAAMRRLAALMRERRIDAVHAHMYRANVPATVAARWAGVPRVWGQVHNVNTWETPRQAWVDRQLCRWRAGMIAVSREVQRDVMDRLRLPAERVRVLYNGVDLARFGSGAGREELRADRGVQPGDAVLLLAARMVEQKRPQDFLALARYLMTESPRRADLPPLRFWLVGEGGMLDGLRREAAALPFADRVTIFGRRDDMERVMAAADLFVMPSTKEGFSNALLEAMASGLAIVATQVGGNAEAIRDGRDGRIVPPRNPAALREAAQTILLDAESRASLAASARQRAKAFSLDAMVGQVEALYGEGGKLPESARS